MPSRLGGRFFQRLLDLALQHPRLAAQLAAGGRGQKGVDAAALLDRADGTGAHPDLDLTVERVAEQRGVLQIGQEPPLGLVVRVADVVPALDALAGEIAAPCHGSNPDIVAFLAEKQAAGRSPARRRRVCTAGTRPRQEADPYHYVLK